MKMIVVKYLTAVLLLFISFAGLAQKQEKVLEYINQFKDLAIAEMQRTGVPASITLAQGIHESGAGASPLALASNNHFGIKCKSSWTGESVKHDDDARGECFRKYPSSADSYKDHSDFLKNGQRYAFLFLLDPTDYQGWANGLKKAGYATNPKYPQVLIRLIEDYELQAYTLLAMNSAPANDPPAEIKWVQEEQDDSPVINSPAKENEPVQATNKTAVTYPQGVFRINETKVVFVRQGTPFLAIAKEYETDLSRIFEFNDMPPRLEVEKDQLIYLQRKRKTGNADFHIVQVGETVYDIAQQEAIRLESLRELNWLKKNDIPAPGEKLYLKTKAAVMPKLALKVKQPVLTTTIIK